MKYQNTHSPRPAVNPESPMTISPEAGAVQPLAPQLSDEPQQVRAAYLATERAAQARFQTMLERDPVLRRSYEKLCLEANVAEVKARFA